VAKSRSKKARKGGSNASRTRKGGSAKRGAASRGRRPKKAKARRPARKSAGPPKKNELDLKQLRSDLERAVTTLRRRSTHVGGSELVDSAQGRMTDFIASIDRFCSEEDELFCGSTMIIPFEQ